MRGFWMMNKTYKQLLKYDDYDLRLKYLMLNDKSFYKKDSFLIARRFFYKTYRWRKVREQILMRDNGCDLGINSLPITGKIFIHHIEPVSIDDINNDNPIIYDENNLICVSLQTHNLIHYGLKNNEYEERKPDDTTIWK